MPPLDLSPEKFRELADRVADLCTEYLDTLDRRPIFPATTGAESQHLFQTNPPQTGLAESSLTDLSAVVNNSRVQNARFFGYVLGSAEPVAALGDLLASVLGQNVTAWRSGPAAVTIERTVIGWLAQAIGCNEFGGSLTGGGSSANLMGLAMASEAGRKR